MNLQRPMPVPTPVTRPFWDALREHRIQLQQCADCHRWIWYPRARCQHCGGGSLHWREISGRGRLYSFCVTTVPTAPVFADELPQRLAIIELEEGVRLTSTLVGVVDDAGLRVGMAVRPHFDDSGPATLLRFEPVPEGDA